MSRASLKIDFVSDIVCPWCAIGLNALERALERLGDRVAVDLRFQPFELNPDMGPEGADIFEYLGRKYGRSREQIEQTQAAIRERGAQVGFAFHPDGRQRTWNSFAGHRLLWWAETVDRADPERKSQQQRALKHALLLAYFGEGRNPADAEVLVAAAAKAGLDPARAREIVANGEFADPVRERERHWQRLGISAVPSVIVNDQHLIQGGQPVEVFERALLQLAAA